MCTFFADLEVRVTAAEENIQGERCYACVYAESVPISQLKEMKEKTMFIVIRVNFFIRRLTGNRREPRLKNFCSGGKWWKWRI